MNESPSHEKPKMLQIREAARTLGVDHKTLRRWCDRGLVPHIKLPSGYRRFTPEHIQAIRASMERRV
jgi:DNA-binding transcriptional MerR regulator